LIERLAFNELLIQFARANCKFLENGSGNAHGLDGNDCLFWIYSVLGLFSFTFRTQVVEEVNFSIKCTTISVRISISFGE
jgi:hypothetical protein